MPKLKLRGIDWAIVGGESGPGARPMAAEWVTNIRDQCRKAGVAFHFKQWGGVLKKRNGRLLEGRTWDEMPAITVELLASTPATGRVQLLLERPRFASGQRGSARHPQRGSRWFHMS